MRSTWNMTKETFLAWNEDKAPRLAASLAFYTMFTLAPLLILVIVAAGLAFGKEAAQGQIIGQIQGLVGAESARAIQDFLAQVARPGSGIVATIIGIATLVIGAWWVFAELQDALDTIWEVAPKPGRSLLAVLKVRFVSFTMMFGVGFLLLVSLVISAALSALGTFLTSQLPEFQALLQVLNQIISFAVITLLFAMIYKVVPDVTIAWGDVWMGAGMTALLYTIGKYLIGVYLGTSSTASAYGAAGSLVVILIWVYYSAQILFLGAEFTKVYAKRYGSRILPTEIVVPVTEEARAQQGLPSPAALQVSQQAQAPASGAPAGPSRRRIYDRCTAAVFGFIAGIIVSAAYGAKS
jgi:membrane protein